MANPCKYTLKDGTVLNFTQARQYVMDNIAELTKESPTLKAKYDAATKGKIEEGNQPEYKEGDKGGQETIPSRGNRPVTSSITEEKTEKEKLADQLAANLESSLASQIASEVKSIQPKEEVGKEEPMSATEVGKMWAEKLRAAKLKNKGETYSSLPLLPQAVDAALEAAAIVAEKSGEIIDIINAGLTALKNHPDYINLKDKTLKRDIYNELKKYIPKMMGELAPANVRQSKVINRMLTGGSLSGEQVTKIMEGNAKDEGFTWSEESVSLEETNNIIDALLLNPEVGEAGLRTIALSSSTDIPDWFKVLVAGKLNDIYYQEELDADNEFDKQLARDNAYQMIGVIEKIAKNAGRTMRFIQEVYRQSPIAYAQYTKNRIDLGAFGADAHEENERIAEGIADLFNGKTNQDTTPKQAQDNRKQQEQEAIAEAADQVFEDEEQTYEDIIGGLEAELAGIDEDIAAIEAQIAEERAAKKNNKKPGTGGIGGAIKSSVRNVMGMNEPSDLQKKLSELKANKKRIQDRIKVLKATPSPEVEDEKEQASASEKLAKRILDRTKDKKVKEDDVEKMLIDELFKVAKGIIPKGLDANKPITPLQRLQEAIKNYDQYRGTWDSARGEVEEMIDRMRKTPQEKADMKQALEEYFETELEVPFSKDTAAKFSKEVATNKAISKMIDTYAEMGVDLSLAEDEVVEKMAFSLGLTDERAIDAFREIVQERFEEINNRKLDAKAKRDAQNAAIKEAKEKSKEAEYKEKKRTGGKNENVWQKRREALAKALGKRMAEGLVGKSAKQKTLMDEFAEGIRKTILANTSPIIKAKKADIQKKSSIELLGGILNNMDEYKAVVNEAQAQLAEKYKDNPAALLLLDDAMFGLTEMSFTSKAAQGTIKEALIAAGYSKRVGGREVVDWSGIIGDSATQQEAKDAIYEKVKEIIGESAANKMRDQINAVYEQKVAKKKVDEINKILASQNKPPTKRPIPASVVYKINKLINLNGGVSGANVQSAIGTYLGTTSLTAAQLNRLQNLSQAYFGAQPGFERRQELERMTNYMNFISKGKVWYGVASLHQNYVQGLISGALTTIKNATVVGDLVGSVFKDYAINGFDKNTLKLALQGFKEGFTIAKTVGRGFAGRTLSVLDVEMDGKEQIVPRLAEFAFDLAGVGKGGVVKNAARNIWNSSKYIARLNEGVDSIFGSVSANVAKYNIIKDIYLSQGMSSTEAAKAAYRDLYITPEAFEKALSEARKEYAKRGIVPSDSRLNRRAYEIVESKSTIAPDIKKQGESAAAQITYKEAGIQGVTHLLAGGVKYLNMAINKKAEGNHKNPKVAATLAETAKFFTNSIAPFATSAANITEQSLDWLPVYGTAKYAITKLYTLPTAKQRANGADETIRLKMAMRTLAAKQVISITALGVIAAYFLVSDDDDEEELLKKFDIVKGTGGQYVRKQMIPTSDKARSVGPIPIDFTASFQTALLLLADYRAAIKANPDTDEKTVGDRAADHLIAIRDAYFTAVLSQSILKGVAEMVDAGRKSESTSGTNFIKKKFANVVVGSTVPSVGMAKQIGDITSPVKKESLSLLDYMMNEGGAYSTWVVGRPKLDWRGRKYATGDIYASNTRYIMGLDPILKADAIDEWATDLGLKTTAAKTEYDIEELNQDREIFALVAEDGQNMLFDKYQNYDFKKIASDRFDTKLKYLWSRPKYQKDMKAMDTKEAQKLINELWSASKLEALYIMNQKISPKIMKSDYPTIEDYQKRNNRFKEIKTSEQLQREVDMKEAIMYEKEKNRPR